MFICTVRDVWEPSSSLIIKSEGNFKVKARFGNISENSTKKDERCAPLNRNTGLVYRKGKSHF